MPSKYTRPTPADIARRIYGTFTSILHTDHGIDEEEWDHMPEEIKSSFIEAVDMVVKEELETIANVFDREVNEVAGRKAQAIADEIVASAPPPPRPDGKPVVCYYCGKRRAVKWYACEECLRP
jgi:hypothetical protein